MKFGFIERRRNVWPVAWLCEALGVSRSGFHAWLGRGPSERARTDVALLPLIRSSFTTSSRTYGARRVWRDVLETGASCGLHRVERLMRANALRARPRRRALPSDNGERSTAAIAPNVLDRQFSVDQPNRKWIADFTLYLDGRRMALRCCRHRSLLAPCRRLVDEGGNDVTTGHGCADDGDLVAREA